MSHSVEVNGREYNWPRKPLVVVCIDGSEPDYIEQAVENGSMPFTEKMLSRGVDLRVDAVVPSFTNPNNLSIVTGCPPSVHGICGNFFYDTEVDQEIMMNDPSLLRAPTIFSAFEREGARIAVITAKDKLRKLLGHGLTFGQEGSVCFSAEKADELSLEEHGYENIIQNTGLGLPSVYSADLSEFVFAAGVKLLELTKVDLMYLSTTDYIQHKFAPGSEGANEFYKMMDSYWAQIDALGANLILTADHGMNPKYDSLGNPDVIYLQDFFDTVIGDNEARVILPITDPYVVHHGALGSFATVYLPTNMNVGSIIKDLLNVDGILSVLTCEEACTRYELPADRMGDLVVISDKYKVLGTKASEHDLSGLDVPLRSHGGSTEQTVPLISSMPLKANVNVSNMRNFDAFHVGLNLLQIDE